MDELMNRSRTFAEAVVTMVWLILLGAALEGISEVKGLDVPKIVLILAGPTIISGICPLLASCCIFKNQRAFSGATALLSAAILFSLACWIALFSVRDLIVACVAGVSLCCAVLRTISYCVEVYQHGHPERAKEFHTVLDGSHEFLCCTTGIHFLWLESLALESLISKRHGLHKGLSEIMGSFNILCCAIGLCTILIQMTPPVPFSNMGHIAGLLLIFDTIMIISICAVLGVAMWKSFVLPMLPLHILGILMILPLVLISFKHICFPEEAKDSENQEPPKLAPLGLTKLMVTGFLAVYISVDSTDRSVTYWFLAFAAAGIISGLTWRLLTQAHVRKVLENNKLDHVSKERKDKTAAVASFANTACFCAHTFIAIAAVLLVIEIYNVKQSTSAVAPAPAPSNT